VKIIWYSVARLKIAGFITCLSAILLIIIGGCNSTTPQDTVPATTPAETLATDTSLTPPWPDTEVFYDETATINVNLLDKFIIRYDYHDIFPIFQVTYDQYTNNVYLLNKAGVRIQNADGIEWFLFQALKECDSNLTITHFNRTRKNK